MGTGLRAEILMALAWLLFPMLPVILEELYYTVFVNLLGSTNAGPEPRDWGWWTWLMMLGPLVGYGFLAGSTAEVSDDVTGPRKGLRRVLARRAVWVAIGPWCGFVVLAALFLGFWLMSRWFPGESQGPVAAGPRQETWVDPILSWAASASLAAIVAYGWLWPAWAAVRRAGRVGLWRSALYRGIGTALAFVGSLFGSFWAITSAWRGYFFDSRVVPLIAAAIGLAFMSGCGSPITYGEMRRRELFHAMLLAWVAGMAMIWWWSSRRRRKRPR